MKKIVAIVLCMALLLSGCGSPDKEIVIPASFFEGTEITQEDINEINDGNYKSATLNDDGSLTLVMTAEQHKETMTELKANMQTSFDNIIADDMYSIEEITYNSDYTEFTVKLSSETLGFADGFAVLTFYFLGGIYNYFNGTPAENIAVIYVDPNGNVINTANSSEMGE